MNKPHEAAVAEARIAAGRAPTWRRRRASASAHPHESAHLHVAGEATYIDDMPELAGTLHAALGLSPVAHGRLKALSTSTRSRALPGVVDVFGARDIPGGNDCGPIVHDDPILADGTVQYLGQPVFVVVAHTRDAARRAAALAKRGDRRRAAAAGADAREAHAVEQYVLPPMHLVRGDARSGDRRARRTA